MVYRKRPEYDPAVPARLAAARQAYDDGLAEVRSTWTAALLEAVDAGMSYAEIRDLTGVSPSTIREAAKTRETSET